MFASTMSAQAADATAQPTSNESAEKYVCTWLQHPSSQSDLVSPIRVGLGFGVLLLKLRSILGGMIV